MRLVGLAFTVQLEHRIATANTIEKIVVLIVLIIN